MPDDDAFASTTADFRPTHQRVAGLSVPGYRMLGVLGEGGMGTVYSAEQDAPRRQVAIKVLHARSGNALIRFQTEAEVMARLDHPGIARVLEAGETDGRPFLVMEHVDGVTLDRDAPKRSVDGRLELFAAICDAVQHAHVKGVIHRDLKPVNVMVRDDGRPVVLDFGVARLATDDGKTPGQTRAGELIGTPLYMSPEQARLRADEVDARSDIYTLGVILYELACGQLPYELENMPLPAVACVICDDPPIPLGKRDVALRGDLEAITAKALAKDPRDRYASAAALADDVRRFVAREPVSVRNATSGERLVRFVKRRPLTALAIGGGVLATATFAAVVTGLWLDARSARRVADDARLHAELARAELEARTNQLTLRQARAALTRDPTEAIAWLSTLTIAGVDAGTAWGVAEEALARGVAANVLRADTDEVHWVEPMPPTVDAGFVTGSYDGRALLWTGMPPTPHVLLTEKRGRVHVVRPSPDGAMIAIGGDDGDLDIVARDGRVLAELPGQIGDVQHITWSADGTLLATGDDHGNVWLWPKGAAPGRRLAAGASVNEALAFADTGHTLIAGDRDGNLSLWDLDANTSWTANAGAAIVEAWTDGKTVASVDADGGVRRWHVADASPALVADSTVATGRKCKRAVFAAHAAWVVLGGVGGTVSRVIGDRIEPLAAYRTLVRSLAISPDERRIAAASDDGALEVIDLLPDHSAAPTVVPNDSIGRSVALRGHSARVRHLAFTDGGRVLLSADADGLVRRWDLGAMPPTMLDAHGAVTERMAVSADSSLLAAVDAAGEVQLWKLADGSHTHVGHVEVPVHEARAGDAADPGPRGAIDGRGLSPTGSAAEWRRGSIEDARPHGRAASSAIDPAGRVMQVAIAGDTVVTGTAEGAVTWWSAAPVAQTVHGIVKAIATTRDRVAVATSSGPIAMFTLAGAPLPALAGHGGGTETLAFDPHGMLLASGGQDRAIRVWRRDGDTFTLAATLANPHGDAHFVAFSPAGDLLFAASNDGSVIAWTVRGAQVDVASARTIGKHVGAVTALAIDPNGRWVASAGRDAHVVRAPIERGVVGTSESIAISAAGTALAFDPAGDVYIVTRAGAVERWSHDAGAIIEIDHGIRDGAQLLGQLRWALAYDDGTIVLGSLAAPPLADLAPALAKATTFVLPDRK